MPVVRLDSKMNCTFWQLKLSSIQSFDIAPLYSDGAHTYIWIIDQFLWEESTSLTALEFQLNTFSGGMLDHLNHVLTCEVSPQSGCSDACQVSP